MAATTGIRRKNQRNLETIALLVVFLLAAMGFLMVEAARKVQQGEFPVLSLVGALMPPLSLGGAFFAIHLLLRRKKIDMEQVLLPAVGMLFSLGLVMIWRLRGQEGVWQQITRGLLPGMILVGILIVRPRLIEQVRRMAIPISILGLALPFLTALFGVVDETGARLALKIGPLPPVQTTEFLKVSLIIFLAWFIEREGRHVEGRARPVLGWLRLPAFRYFIPGLLFVSLSTLALVMMSDFGAALILGFLFAGMLYAGFETRIFATIAAIGLGLAILAGLVLVNVWEIPTVIRYRFMAFMDPWSNAVILQNGQSTGITISQGPGYQIQQSIYAVIAGGITGKGLGFGLPEYVPLAHSDFIFAALVEELGAVTGIAVLALFTLLMLRILRVALLLPQGQVFERLLLIGISIHLFTQVFIMVGGTLNLLPLTGVTIPFMSLGGTSLLVNLAEIGIALSLVHRLEDLPPA